MGYLPDHKARTIFVTGSTVIHHGKRRTIIIESRPEYALVRLNGTRTHYPLAWEHIYEAAVAHHAANLRLEAHAGQRQKKSRGPKPK